MKHSPLFVLALYGSCLLTACGGGGPSDPAVEPATHLTVAAPTTATAGTAFNIRVTALDATNQVVAGYSGPVHFSSTDRQAVLPANSKLTNGMGSFSATLGTGGSQNITVADTVTASITGASSAIDVSDPATHLSVSAPSTTVAGTSFKVTVTALDAANKVVAGYSGTVHFSSSDHGAALPYDSKMTSGTGTFSATLRTAGSQTITGTDAVTASIAGTSNSITVSVYRNCLAEGAECLSSYPPCCSGLVCRAATTRAYCEPVSAAAGSAASKAATRLAALFPQAPRASSNSVPNGAAMHHHYKLIDMGTFGGPQSYAPVSSPFNSTGLELNNSGVLVGFADTSIPDPIIPLDPPGMSLCFNFDCDVAYTFQWQSGVMSDLGSLRRGWSSAPTAISANGLIAGYSENGKIDPLLSTPQLETAEVRAVLWQNGHITNLGTLPEGGYESAALAVNSAGQVVGAAMNTIPDANPIIDFSVFPIAFQTTQTRAFLWDGAVMRDLGTLGGTDAVALAINERGQIMGLSYTSTTQPSACNPTGAPVPMGSFIWDQKHGMRNVGTLGGTCTQAFALNNRGQVAGVSFLTGDQNAHAFLWEDGVIQDLGPLNAGCTLAFGLSESGQVVGVWCLPTGYYHAALWTKVGQTWQITDLGTTDTDPCSNAFDVNAQGQVVGGSQSLAECQGEGLSTTAFLWENGSIVDLNTLIPPGSPLYLVNADRINDRGEIAGFGRDANANNHAFLLIPCDVIHPDEEGCDYSRVDAATAAALYRPSFAVDPAVANQAERSPASAMGRVRSLMMKRSH